MEAYLASPFFSHEERQKYHRIISLLRDQLGYELYVPMEHTIENAWNLPNHTWAKAVFEEDIRAIDEAEVVIVVNFGMYSDSGTAWEAGYAYAKGKTVVNMLVGEGAEDYSLMMINGCHQVVWENMREVSLGGITQK